jgi:hypothetical protein
MKFKHWLEQELQQNPNQFSQNKQNPLQEDGEIERIFTQAKQRLTGGLKTDPTLALSRLNNGPNGAADVLKPIFSRLAELGEPWNNQAEETRNWLNQLSNGNIKNSSSATVGKLLSKLFGKKIYEKVMKQPAPIDDNFSQPTDFQNPNKQQQSMEKIGNAGQNFNNGEF